MRVYGKLQLAEGVRDGKNAYRRSTSRKRMAAFNCLHPTALAAKLTYFKPIQNLNSDHTLDG